MFVKVVTDCLGIQSGRQAHQLFSFYWSLANCIDKQWVEKVVLRLDAVVVALAHPSKTKLTYFFLYTVVNSHVCCSSTAFRCMSVLLTFYSNWFILLLM